MKDYTKLITDLRRCQFGYCLCPECSYYGQKGSWDDDDLADCDDKMHLDAAAAIEELQAEVKRLQAQLEDRTNQDEMDKILEDLRNASVGPIEPMRIELLPKRGEWKPFDLTWGRSIYSCTVCGEATEVPTANGKVLYNYCPNCGARMYGERKEGEG